MSFRCPPRLAAALAAAAAAAACLPAAADADTMPPTNADGSQVPIFSSPGALVPGDVNGGDDLYTRIGGAPVLLSGGKGAGSSTFAGANASGTVAFFTTANALSPSDKDGSDDLYMRSPNGLTVIAPDVATSTPVEYQGHSANASTVWLRTQAKLTPSDTDEHYDVYAYHVGSGTFTLLSVGTPSSHAEFVGADATGWVSFTAADPVLASDTDTKDDVYRVLGATVEKVSPGNGPHEATGARVLPNGDVIVSTLEPVSVADDDDERDLYRRFNGGGVEFVSPSPNLPVQGRPVAFVAAAKGGGRVVFISTERLAAGDVDGWDDLYAYDAGTVKLLSPGTELPVSFSDASDDAQTVLFRTQSKALPSDSDTAVDMYTAGPAGLDHVVKSNLEFPQRGGHLSADGTRVALETAEPLAGSDDDDEEDVYLRTPQAFKLASVRQTASNGKVSEAKGYGFLTSGELILATGENLVAEDEDEMFDVYGFNGITLTLHSHDTSAPDTAMAAKVLPSPATQTVLSATFTATESATFECRVDAGAWAACGSPWTPAPFGPGKHTIAVRATDLEGNTDTSPAVHAFDGPQLPTDVLDPPPPPPGGGTPPPVQGPVTPPVVASVDRSAPVIGRAAVRRRGGRATLSWTLSETAQVVVQVRRGARAVKSLRVAGKTGANRRAVALPRGRGVVKLVLTATDAAGNRSRPVTRAVRR